MMKTIMLAPHLANEVPAFVIPVVDMHVGDMQQNDRSVAIGNDTESAASSVLGALRQRTFDEIDRHTLQNWRSLLRFLGLDGNLSYGYYFEGMVAIPGYAEKQSLLMDVGDGNWRIGSDLYRGKGFISLAACINSISPILAAQMMKKALRDIGDDDGQANRMHLVTPIPQDAPPRPIPPAWLEESRDGHDEVYIYRTELGQPAGEILSYALKPRSKLPCYERLLIPRVVCRADDGTLHWQNKLPPGEWVLYGLEQLATNPDAPVILVSGEHNADYIRGFAFSRKEVRWPPADAVILAVSGLDPDGTKTDLSPLVGRAVYVWPVSGDIGQVFVDNIERRLWQEDSSTSIAKVSIRYESRKRDDDHDWMARPISMEGWHWRDFKAHIDDPLAKLTLHLSELRRKSDLVVQDKEIGDFIVDSTGVWVRKYRNGESETHLLSSPIHILYLARNPGSQEWGIGVTCRDPDRRWHTWCIPKSLLAADQAGVYKVLSSLGATITPYANLRTELSRYLLTVEPGKRALSVTKTGWHRNQFVLPDGSVINAEGDNDSVVLQTQDPMGGGFVKQRGSLRQWQRTVGALSLGNSRIVLAIAAALAGPVLALLGEENGGLHFRGNSSIGKTTILYTACSVWGPPRQFMRLWRATANGLESVAASHNDLVLVLDEMSQVASTEVGPAAYLLANGQGKLRATQTGDAKPNASWRLIFLSSGEIGLKDHIESGGGRVMAGQETRLIDIEADAGIGLGIFDILNGLASGAELSLTLKSEADQCHGVVGRAWLEILADPEKRESIVADIRLNMDAFVTAVPTDAAGQVSRVARRFGLFAAVGEAAIKQGILPWPEGHVMAQVMACFQGWLGRRGGAHNLEASQAIEAARRFLQLHGESRFTPMRITGVESDVGNDGGSRTISRAGFRRDKEDGSTEFLVFPEIFEREVCGGLNKKAVAAELLRQGYLVPGANGKPYKTVRLPSIGASKVYCIKSTILGGNAEDAPSDD